MDYGEKYGYYLHKWDVATFNFRFFTRVQLPPSGFRSLYAVDKETAETLQGTTANQFKGIVWSDKLWLDFDTPESGLEAWRRTAELSLKAELWFTGNRGYHIGIERPHAPSHLLPAIDKEWVTANFPKADKSIYNHMHLWRMEGSRHKKTGDFKKLLETRDGDVLILADKLETPPSVFTRSPTPFQSVFEDVYIMSLTSPCSDGERHQTLMSLGLALKNRGEPIGFIERWLHHTNLMFPSPKPPEEVDRLVDFVDRAEVI